MVDFYFDKSFFQTPFYLYCKDDGTTEKLSASPANALCIGSKEAWVVSKLYGFWIPEFPPNKFRHFFIEQGIKDIRKDVPWSLVLPEHVYKREVRRIVEQLRESLTGLDLTYYNEFYCPENRIFSDLKPAKINVEKIIKILSAHEDTQGHLKSFLPVDGYAKVPKYTRIKTRTGRLKVDNGPMILNVKKEHRKVLESRFAGGSIWQLDYSSLEPRVLLALNSEKDIPKDVYQSALDTFDLEGIPRDAIKQAVLSRIFGATDYTIEQQLKGLVDYPSDILGLVDDYFGIDDLKQNLALELSKNDGNHITNFYGRRVMCDDTPLYVLINYFIQSTSVDVAMLGFNQINDKIKEAGLENKILLLYILHDALYMDVHPDYEYLIPKLCKVGSTNIPKFENINFYLKPTKEV